MTNGDTWLKRSEILPRLEERGLPLSGKHLAVLERRGEGPAMCRWGRQPRYRWTDVLAWAEARLGTTTA